MISTTLSPLVEKLSNFLSAHPDHPVLVALDGRCGSGKTTLAVCYDLKVFVTCSKEEQARRLLAREGERYSGFTARWIPLEEGYFAKFQIEQTVDFIFDTTC